MHALKKPDLNKLVILTVIQATCVHCKSVQSVNAHSLEVAARELAKFGWRSYQKDNLTVNVCRHCCQSMKQSHAIAV